MKLNLFFEMPRKGKTLVVSYLKTMYNSDPFGEGRAMENLHNINQNDSLFNQSIWSRGSMQELLKSQEKELTKVKGFLRVSHFPQCLLTNVC